MLLNFDEHVFIIQPNCFDYSDIDELGGKLSQYWFSIDQSLSNKDSPNHISDSDHLSTNIGSKIRTATGFQVRSRRSATSGLMRTGQSVCETATSSSDNRFAGNFQPKDHLKLERINSDTSLIKRGSKSKDIEETDEKSINDITTNLSLSGKQIENGKFSVSVLFNLSLSLETTYQSFLKLFCIVVIYVKCPFDYQQFVEFLNE